MYLSLSRPCILQLRQIYLSRAFTFDEPDRADYLRADADIVVTGKNTRHCIFPFPYVRCTSVFLSPAFLPRKITFRFFVHIVAITAVVRGKIAPNQRNVVIDRHFKVILTCILNRYNRHLVRKRDEKREY